VSDNEWWFLYEDNNERMVTCPKCEKDFEVEVHCTYKFSTDEQP
jgi:hypothetical protein